LLVVDIGFVPVAFCTEEDRSVDVRGFDHLKIEAEDRERPVAAQIQAHEAAEHIDAGVLGGMVDERDHPGLRILVDQVLISVFKAHERVVVLVQVLEVLDSSGLIEVIDPRLDHLANDGQGLLVGPCDLLRLTLHGGTHHPHDRFVDFDEDGVVHHCPLENLIVLLGCHQLNSKCAIH